MDLDLEELAAIVELLERFDFTDFRFENGDFHIAVRRGGGPPLEQSWAGGSARDIASAAVPNSSASIANAQPAIPGSGSAHHALVRAPLPGAFYRGPKPGQPPFVEVGSRVEADTVVCIIEVMKLMNSVTAGVTGEVMEIYARDGDVVQSDQPLFAVLPA